MIRGKLRMVSLAVVVATALIGCATVASAATAAHPTPFRVTGYAEAGGTSAAKVDASRKALTMVGVDGVNLTPNGAGITDVDPSALTLLHQAHKLGKKAELLVGNFSSDLGDFDDALAEKMFDSDANIDGVVAALQVEVAAHHWDGITVDLEGLNGWGAEGHTRDDNAGLAAFIHALKVALGAKSVSICLTATPGSYADLGYDIASLGKDADHIVLMAYDQHGPTWSDPGPVGGLPWVKASLVPLTKALPNAKIQLGIAGYGYFWPADGTDGDQLSDAAARLLVKNDHAKAVWSASQKEWHATLSGGTILWWSDTHSYAWRKHLAQSLKLGGIAVWSLTVSDPLR